MRAFIAVELPQDIKDLLGRQKEQLQNKITAAKWVEPENLHLTIKFLGEIDEKEIPSIQKSLELTAKAVKKIPTRLNGFGVFPNPKNPQVLFAALAQEADLMKLYQTLSANFEGEMDMLFKAHITLCRFKEKMFFDPALAKLEPINFVLDNLTLFKSKLTAQGALHDKIFSCLLT